MKKIVGLLIVLGLLGTGFAVAAESFTKISNTRIIRAAKDTTITYNGVKVFIPAGQTVVLAQNADGSVILRGNNLNAVKVENGFVSSIGMVLLIVQPKTQVITVARGTHVVVQDPNGRTARLSQGASVSALDVQAHVASPSAVVEVSNTQESVGEEGLSFVSEAQISNTASEQAVQDVIETEEVLSPSAPH